MLSDEEPEELESAINKLRDFHSQGEELANVLKLSPGGYARDGALREAAEVVGEKWGAKLTDERARKAIDFSIEYSSPQRSKLIERCQKKRFCPEIGTMIRLLPLAPRERNKLLTLVLNNRWTRVDLDAEIERRKPADNTDGHKRRGRLPKAAKSIQVLAGKANINAREYSHVLEVLSEEDANYKLSSRRKKELEILIELLRKIGKWG